MKALRARLLLLHLGPVVLGGLVAVAIGAISGHPPSAAALIVIAALVAATAAFAALLVDWRIRRALGMLAEATRPRTGTYHAVPAEGTFNAIALSVANAVAEARAERARLAAVLERSADGVIAVDDEGVVRYLNPAARRLLEVGDRACDGYTFVALVRDHEIAGILQSCRESNAQESAIVEVGPLRRPIEAIFMPLEGAGAWKYLGLLHDLTEVKRAEGQRRDFVSNVSHELRTPLASIKAVVQVLADGGLDDTEQALELLRDVDREVDRLSQLVEEMLELSRIESGAVPFRFEPTSAADLCAEAVDRLSLQAERQGVALHWTAASGMRPLRADRERLLRALINLVHNAIKFTPPGGTVTVYARGCGDRAAIGVRDTGIGIPAEDLGRIFERFYKVDRARSSHGTGLGLAIVKHTVQAHQGTIEVQSEPGQGSDFRMLLPYA